MAEGLLQMLGSGQQAQQQQQGNLLGGLFQSESQARRQGRERLLGQALQIAQQQDPIGTGFAVAGGLLGEGIGRAMGRVTPEEARQQKFAGLQTQLMQEGLDPTQDPAGFYTRLSELLQNQGDMQTALRAAAKAREFAPEPVETQRIIRGGTQEGDIAGLAAGQQGIGTFVGDQYRGISNVKPIEDQDDVDVGAVKRFIDTQNDTTLSLVRTGEGYSRQTVDAQGNVVFTPVDMTNLEPVSARETGGAGDFGSGGDFSDLGNLRNVTVDFAERANQLKSELRAGVVGIPAGVASGYASASSQIAGILEETLGINDTSPSVESAYSDTFEELNLSNASSEVKSALIGAARVNAYLQQGGQGDTRKSEIQDSLRQLRIGSGNPEAIAAALGRTTEDAIRRFNIARVTAGQATGEEVPFDPLRPEDYGLGPAAAEQSGALTVERVEGLSMSDLQSLNPNEIPNDPRILQAIDNRLNELEDQMGSRVRGGGAR